MIKKLKSKIALLIAIGNALILVLLIAIGFVFISNMHHLAAITTNLYQHPFMVNRAALNVRYQIEHMRDRMLEIALSRDPKRASDLSAELSAIDNDVSEHFRIVEENYLGDPKTVKEVRLLLDEWRDIRIRTIDLAMRGQWNTVEKLVMVSNRTTYVQVGADVDDIVAFTQRKAAAFAKEANDVAMSAIARLEKLLAVFATIIFVVGLTMSRRTWSLIRAEEVAAEAASKSERSYRSLYENMLEGYVHGQLVYTNGRPQDYIFLDVNRAFEQLTGLSDVVGRNASAVIPGIWKSNPELLEAYGRVALSGRPERFETHVKPLAMWLSVSVYSTEKDRFVTVFDNVTKRKNDERQWRLAESLFHASSEGMLITDFSGNIISINRAFTQITGYGADEVIGKNLLRLRTWLHAEAFFEDILHSITTTGHWEGELWNKNKADEDVAMHLIISEILDETNGRSYAVQFSDTTEKKKMEEDLSRHAHFDSLTGLANRRMFREHLEQEIRKSNRSHISLALLFIDLDRFKTINDTLGHHVGDQLLVEAAKRIVSCVRETDIVSRLGGDEFTVILANVTDVNHIENVAHAIVQSLAQPYLLGGEELSISASVGIAVYPTDAANPADLLRNADQAMYMSKSEGRNCFHFFTKAMQEATFKHHQLVQDLRAALLERQLQLYFQPIVDLRSGKIFKAETLLRWRHPLRGMIEPAEFIPVAEEIGLIDEIGSWVFKEALAQCKHWSALLGHAFRIGVNISPSQLMSHGRNNVWINHVHEIDLSGTIISIEITEGTLLNDRPEVAAALLSIHAAGMEVSIDDFGTGYSSLSYLQKFKIDFLKIDRSFTCGLKPDSTELALSEAIIVMAHKLGIKVIAEGIETAEQRDLLVAAGCDFGQGYLFSGPVPPEEFEVFLIQSRFDSDTRSTNGFGSGKRI